MDLARVCVTGTDDKPVINMTTVATVTAQAGQTLSLSPDTVHVALNVTDDDLTNTGRISAPTQASAIAVTGVQAGVVLNPHDLLVVLTGRKFVTAGADPTRVRACRVLDAAHPILIPKS